MSSLVLVGLPFLYKDVVLHHVSQVSTLLRTLEYSSDRNLKEMIKTVEVNCFVPKRYMQKFEDQLSLLLKSCPQIISFTLGHCIPSSLTTHLRFRSRTLLTSFGQRIRCGYSGMYIEGCVCTPYLPSFPYPQRHITLGPTTLPLLRTLSVMTVWGRDSPWFDKFIDVCKMPSLTSALFSSSSALESVTRFITVFGSELRFLQCASQDRYMRETNFRTILDSCRLLEHVALSPESLASLLIARSSGSIFISHQTLRQEKCRSCVEQFCLEVACLC
ncbi:hypothetical protein CPB84DRAFT_1229249 [Gymnopilus junonius]|uniref:Uncharacterized protein n=1 Tax=Gymnopilus junonius TaxID=109634 RepID=A0A9P5NZJ4_GYMJU|nr:hypothetical protein CPB84DRAFT_1229249 [Gymnopilus junonius]